MSEKAGKIFDQKMEKMQNKIIPVFSKWTAPALHLMELQASAQDLADRGHWIRSEGGGGSADLAISAVRSNLARDISPPSTIFSVRSRIGKDKKF